MVIVAAPVRAVKAQSKGRVNVKLVRDPLVIALATVPLRPCGCNDMPDAVKAPAIGFPPIIPPPDPIPLELTGITFWPGYTCLASKIIVNGRLDKSIPSWLI